MRAGVYAVFHGRVFECIGEDGSTCALVCPISEPQPEGFRRHPRGWLRDVDKSEIEKMFVVKTVGVWQGRRVKVLSVHDDVARLEGSSSGPREVPQHPAVQHDNPYGDWSAHVPVWELTEVVETVADVPLK